MSTTAVGITLDLDGPLLVGLCPRNPVLDFPDSDFGYAEALGNGHLGSLCMTDGFNLIGGENRMQPTMLFPGHERQMSRVDACRDLTEVMNFDSLWDGPDVDEIRESMGAVSSVPYSAVTPFIQTPLPDPACSLKAKIEDAIVILSDLSKAAPIHQKERMT